MAEWWAQGLHWLQQQQHQEHSQAALVSVLLVVPLVVLLLVRRITTADARAREQQLNKLPSPPGLPVIGHLHLVGSLPHISVRELAAKHGRDGILLLRLGSVPSIVISSAAAAEAVLRTHDHVFASRNRSTVTEILFYGSSDVAFAPHGEHWRQVKKISTTHLLSNKKVRSYRGAREQEVRLVMAHILEAALAGTTFDLSTMFYSFLNNIICHAVFGRFFKEGGRGRNKIFQELVEQNALLLGGFNIEDYFPNLVRLNIVKRLVCAKVHKVHKMWDDLLNKLIEEHEIKPASQVDTEESDFIDVLLSIQQEYQLTKDHIKAQLVVMFQGGIDTASGVLDYAMVKLMQNPHLLTKLQNEVRMVVPPGKEMVTEDDLDGMAYLKAVVKETLRLHGPAPFLLPHFSMADCVIEGYTIPSGIRIIINSMAISRDPNYWESAEEFIPERFMEGGSAAALDYKGNDYVFVPFGSGRRKCPGINFAIPTVELMLANLMYHFNWELTPESAKNGIDMTESFGATVHRIKSLVLAPVLPQN
ncbi:hypothetical protein EJB05_15886 [Eragrostis curvula]|uniref:Uncharacterized protein n=1 Tax=Eragrostis curvula TaxID=38414 RepID=A0A5J9VF40_9POAL|nr:hypothetical protein EJB05_15886 [Eragrostis curvula]